MEAELSSLEQKINQLVQLCHRLRTDNSELRQHLAAATNEARLLQEKIGGAKARLEAILSRIPEDVG